MHRHVQLATLIALVLLAGACRDDRPALTEPRQPAYAKVADRLKVDQSNTKTDHLGPANGFYGQSFVPKADNLARVDVLRITNQVPAEGSPTYLGLYTAMDQPAVDSVFVNVDPPHPGEIERVVSYVFSSPLPLVKGATYILGWHGTTTTAWELTQTDAYPYGQALEYDGSAFNPSSDFVFTTYALKY